MRDFDTWKTDAESTEGGLSKRLNNTRTEWLSCERGNDATCFFHEIRGRIYAIPEGRARELYATIKPRSAKQ